MDEGADSLRSRADERSTRLADYIDALLYFGPEPNRSVTGAVPLSAAHQREVARRAAITDDPQRRMQARFQVRARRFEHHPNDIPTRPAPRGPQSR